MLTRFYHKNAILIVDEHDAPYNEEIIKNLQTHYDSKQVS